MNLETLKTFILNISKGELSQRQKIFTSTSLGWIIFIGYLTWWNGIKSSSLDKSF